MKGLKLQQVDHRDGFADRPAADAPILTPEICRQARAKLGWTPDRLASAAGLSRPTIIQFENETCTPRVGTLIALRKALRRAGALDLAE